MENLSHKVDVENNLGTDQKIAIAKLQNEITERDKENRNLETNMHKLQNALDIQSKDLELEQAHNDELSNHLKEIAVKNRKYITRNRDLKSECKRLKAVAKDVNTKLIYSEDDNNELRSKFATVGEQMEVMLATESQSTSETIHSLQNKLQQMRNKHADKIKTHKQLEKSLKLELANSIEQLENGRRTTSTLTDQNSKLTAELETTVARLEAAMTANKSLKRDLQIEEEKEIIAKNSAGDFSISSQQQQQHYEERLEDRVRAATIETEAKTTAALREKYEKYELEAQSKYQDMVARMEASYKDLADLRKAENEAAIEKHKRFEAEYVLKTEHAAAVEVAVAKAREARDEQNDIETKLQIDQVKDMCENERKHEVNILQQTVDDHRTAIEKLNEQIQQSEENLQAAKHETQVKIAEIQSESENRRLLADHLEEANMNLARLALLIKTSEEEKAELKRTMDDLKTQLENSAASLDETTAAKSSAENEVQSLINKLQATDGLLAERDATIKNLEINNSKLEERIESGQKRIEDREARVRKLEEEAKSVAEMNIKMREVDVDRAREDMVKVTDWQAKMETSNQEHARQMAESSNKILSLEVDVTKMQSDIATKEAKISELVEKISDQKSQIDDLTRSLEQQSSQQQVLLKEEKTIEKSLKKSSKSIFGVQRVMDRKLVPLKIELDNAKKSIKEEMESFSVDFIKIVKQIHNKWAETSKVQTRRLSMTFEKSMADMRINLGAEKEKGISKVLQEEIRKRESEVGDKNDEIEELNEVIRGLRDRLDSQREENELKRERLNTEAMEHLHNTDKIVKEKEKLELLNDQLTKRVKILEEANGELKLKFEASLDKDEQDRAKFDHVAGRLNTLVVLLEADLRLGGAVESMLLSDDESKFREGMREMQNKWREEVERAKKEIEGPLLDQIQELKDTNRGIVSELGLTGESKNLAEARIKECEVDIRKLEEQNNLLNAEVDTLREKSEYCDDLEKSRGEISMVAELQKIEAESRLTSLTQEVTNIKRAKSEELAEADRITSKKLFEAGEAFQKKVKKISDEKNAAVADVEERLTKERRKARELSERIHEITIKHHKEISEMQMRIHVLQNSSERNLLKLSSFKHETEEFCEKEESRESSDHNANNAGDKRNTSVEELLD